MPTYSFLQEQGLITQGEKKQEVIVEHVLPGGLADQAGITEKQKIINIANTPVDTSNLTNVLGKQFGKTFPIKVADDDGNTKMMHITCPDDECVLGIAIALDDTSNIAPIKFTGLQAFVA